MLFETRGTREYTSLSLVREVYFYFHLQIRSVVIFIFHYDLCMRSSKGWRVWDRLCRLHHYFFTGARSTESG